jgi:hypothetical protein
VGSPRSIALLERLWRTLKEAIPWTWCVLGTPAALAAHAESFRGWYNSERPHTALAGAAPDDLRLGRKRRRLRASAGGKWTLGIRWTGPARDWPIVRLRKIA